MKTAKRLNRDASRASSGAEFVPDARRVLLPEWLQHEIAVRTRRFVREAEIRGRSRNLEILKRLVSGPRMKAVWREIYRKNTADDHCKRGFMHPARVEKLDAWRNLAEDFRRSAVRLRAERSRRVNFCLNEDNLVDSRLRFRF